MLRQKRAEEQKAKADAEAQAQEAETQLAQAKAAAQRGRTAESLTNAVNAGSMGGDMVAAMGGYQ